MSLILRPRRFVSDLVRVVLAEDHYLVREGIRRLLEDSGEVTVLDAVGNAEELIERVAALQPDAVLTDIRMPPGHHMEGIEAAHRIRADHPAIGVVVLSQHADEAYAFELLRNGADGLGYLLKDRVGDLAELVGALRATSAGRSWVDSRVVDALVRRQARRDGAGASGLSPREQDVIREMARGLSNPGIAAELVLSESAVEKHVSTILRKLGRSGEDGVHRRVTAVLAYLRGDDGQDLGDGRAP
jgi:DNA-binding NarL/FixJ family response regulator